MKKGKNELYCDIFIISHGKKWGVYKRNSERSLKNFNHRELAFHYAATRFKTLISVHNTDGLVDFKYDNRV
jgi:hypothetical protein